MYCNGQRSRGRSAKGTGKDGENPRPPSSSKDPILPLKWRPTKAERRVQSLHDKALHQLALASEKAQLPSDRNRNPRPNIAHERKAASIGTIQHGMAAIRSLSRSSSGRARRYVVTGWTPSATLIWRHFTCIMLLVTLLDVFVPIKQQHHSLRLTTERQVLSAMGLTPMDSLSTPKELQME